MWIEIYSAIFTRLVIIYMSLLSSFSNNLTKGNIKLLHGYLYFIYKTPTDGDKIAYFAQSEERNLPTWDSKSMMEAL